jgi:hypothetical protein
LNWWLGDIPRRVSAAGRKVFYRPETAAALGLGGHGERCTGCAEFKRCGFRLDISANDRLRQLYAEAEESDGYFRDRCVFSEDIDIADTMKAQITYESNIVVNYDLIAYGPAEGYRVAFYGTRGRLVHSNVERPYVQPDGSLVQPALAETNSVVVQPHFGRAYELVLPTGTGPHAGGDKVMLASLFGTGDRAPDAYGRAADERAGVWSAIVGIAADESSARGTPVEITDLLPNAPWPDYAPAPFGPRDIWRSFDAGRYHFLEGARVQ